MHLAEHDIEIIRIGGLLHDVGKIGVPDSILRKPGKLTSDEMAMLRQHPTIGRRILEGVSGFQEYLPIVELHHENWDGTGYPLQQSGLKIPAVRAHRACGGHLRCDDHGSAVPLRIDAMKTPFANSRNTRPCSSTRRLCKSSFTWTKS